MAANVGSVPTLDANKHLKTKHVDAPVAALVGTPASASAIAVQALISAAITALKGGAASALDTLGEVQTALGNDPNLAATLTAAIAAKATPAQVQAAVDALAAASAATYLTLTGAAAGYVALAQIPVALDTDGVPYIASTSNFSGAVPIKTDTDGVPYLAA